jgi:hypothetical protein
MTTKVRIWYKDENGRTYIARKLSFEKELNDATIHRIKLLKGVDVHFQPILKLPNKTLEIDIFISYEGAGYYIGATFEDVEGVLAMDSEL